VKEKPRRVEEGGREGERKERKEETRRREIFEYCGMVVRLQWVDERGGALGSLCWSRVATRRVASSFLELKIELLLPSFPPFPLSNTFTQRNQRADIPVSSRSILHPSNPSHLSSYTANPDVYFIRDVLPSSKGSSFVLSLQTVVFDHSAVEDRWGGWWKRRDHGE